MARRTRGAALAALVLAAMVALPATASGDFGRVLNMKHNSFCLDSTNNESFDSGRVVIWTCHGGNGNWQKWTAIGLGNGYHQVRSEWDGRCLDINPGQNWYGAPIYRYRCWAWWDSRVQWQSWKFDADGL
jgi:Ricin-type beta-trefoil lectin domain